MPFDWGSTRPITALAAIAASMALPPRSSTCTPARAASGWLAATMPYRVAMRDRPTITLMRTSYTFPPSRCDRVHGITSQRHNGTEKIPDPKARSRLTNDGTWGSAEARVNGFGGRREAAARSDPAVRVGLRSRPSRRILSGRASVALWFVLLRASSCFRGCLRSVVKYARETWTSLPPNPRPDQRAGPDPARHRAADHRSPWPGVRAARARGDRRPSARVPDLRTRRDLRLVRHRRVGGGAREYAVARRQGAHVRDRPLRRALARDGRAARSAGRLRSRRLAPRRR